MVTRSRVRMPLRAWHLMVLAGAGLMLGVPAARAQNALGDGRVLDGSLRQGTQGYNGISTAGRALDNNLRAGSGGWNDFGRDIRGETAYRNAIVTGNVAGGREFRGSVGYTAADDFRGFLGSNTTYQFERNSFYSGLATRNLTGIDSIRNPLAYTVAGQRDTIFGGGLIINRSGVGATGLEINQAPGQALTNDSADVYRNIAGTLRSPSVQISRNERMPELIAYANAPDEAGVVRVMSASPLIGIRPIRSDSPLFNPVEAGTRSAQPEYLRPLPTGLPVGDASSANRDGAGGVRADEDRRIVSPYQVVMDSLRGAPVNEAIRSTPLALPSTMPDSTVMDQAPPADAGLDRGPGLDAETPAEDVPTGLGSTGLKMPKFDENLEKLRTLLQESMLPRPEVADPGAAAEDDTADAELPRTAPELAAELLSGKSALVIELAESPTPGNIFGEHMRKGQALLKEERWFDAEERFTAALAIRPGDPIAAAARLHAQLGAGMFRSATINMRNLLRAYPEMMVTRFDGSLVGTKERTEKIKAQLRQRMERSTVTARECALLLAYVGYQTEDAATMREAFDRLSEIATDMQSEPDALERTLRAVWLDSPPTPDPAAAP